MMINKQLEMEDSKKANAPKKESEEEKILGIYEY